MNIKRLEYMVEEINDNLNQHLAGSTNTYYYMMQQNASQAELSIKIYNAKGKAECEVVAMPDYSKSGEISCQIKVDGVLTATVSGIMSIIELDLQRGYHTIEFITSDNVACARVRLSGVLSNSTIMSL